jgi:signal-transduction protein with cAMP-binding, CBS, and nucleotidyltransferase domain
MRLDSQEASQHNIGLSSIFRIDTKEDAMPGKVKDWMSSPVIVVDADSSVSYALTLMRRRNIHSLVVMMGEGTPVYGIVTTTDIRDKIIIPERNPAETRVREVMTSPAVIANRDWSLQECSVKMHEARIHHMPVADEYGTLVGLISVTDIFRAAEEIGWGSRK